MFRSRRSRLIATVIELPIIALLIGCAGVSERAAEHSLPAPQASSEQGPPPSSCGERCDTVGTASALRALEKFDEGSEGHYKLGPGDAITVTVWNHPELSGPHLVGPDGTIQMPTLGSVRLSELTANQAAETIKKLLARSYVAPVTTVEINSYTNNVVTVLGDVPNPGVLHFDDQPSLLEVLAKAGSSKGESGQIPAMRCGIFRGDDRALWLNLRPLLRGSDAAFNLRLHRNDIVYVSYAMDSAVFVMGQVTKPGAYPLTPDMSLLQVLSQAGGPNDNAKRSQIVLARPSQNTQKIINLDLIVKGDSDSNYLLQAGDIVYVPKSGIAKVGYVLQQLNPITQTAFIGAAMF